MATGRLGPGGGRRRGPCHLAPSLRSAVARGLLVSVISVVGIAVGAVGRAVAAITITGPGSVTNNPTPSFGGHADGEKEVTLTISRGGEVIGERHSVSAPGGTWKFTAEPLPDGTYTAQATQEGETGEPQILMFTVDTTPPRIALESPVNGSTNVTGSVPVSGTRGNEAGDLHTVTIQLFSGPTTGPAPFEALTLLETNESWSGTLGGLGAGTYTARAEQSDWAGNVGVSAPVTFTVLSAAAPGAVPPLASFRWFPTAPKTGENVSLISTSSDSGSPITAFAWALTGIGPFQAGKPVFTTSFSTPGSHVVRLRVTNGNGLSSVSAQSIQVTSIPLTLMQPFPIVRIAGHETSHGVRLSLLTAQAPAGARVSVSCEGRGCPGKSESRVTLSSRRSGGGSVVQFRRFERALPDGVTLQIRISKPGEIGKYTRFAVRRGRLPERVDMCLGPAGGKPLVCPSS